MERFIYLASASPRRSELLTQIGISHQLRPQDIDETNKYNETAEELVIRLAKQKAQQCLNSIHAQNNGKTRSIHSVSIKLPTTDKFSLTKHQNKLVLGSDTIISIHGQILGKPKDKQEAIAMLQLLSGHTHQVLTAVCLMDNNKSHSILSVSDVTFCPLTQEQIQAYCQTEEPMDKAGSYAIQGKAAIFIEKINGSYSGIMGLPLFETKQLLEQFNFYI